MLPLRKPRYRRHRLFNPKHPKHSLPSLKHRGPQTHQEEPFSGPAERGKPAPPPIHPLVHRLPVVRVSPVLPSPVPPSLARILNLPNPAPPHRSLPAV